MLSKLWIGTRLGLIGTVLGLLPLCRSAAAQVSTPESSLVGVYDYKNIDDGVLKLTINYPSDWHASDSRSAIVFFFGGGWAHSAIDHFQRQAEYFASRGMVAVRPDVRVKNRDGTTPAEAVEDAKSALRWIRQHADSLGVDPSRIVASGGSSGGHLAACTAQCASPEGPGEDQSVSSKPSALILFNPLLSFTDEIEKAHPVASSEVAGQISPALHIEREDPPTLILFGSEDVLLDLAASYIEKTRRAGNRLDLLVAEGEDHAFFNASPWYERTLMEADRFLVSLGFLAPLPIVRKP